jgi:hypothetical protein
MFDEGLRTFHADSTLCIPELFITKAIPKKIAAENVGLGALIIHFESVTCMDLGVGLMNKAARMVLINTQV